MILLSCPFVVHCWLGDRFLACESGKTGEIDRVFWVWITQADNPQMVSNCVFINVHKGRHSVSKICAPCCLAQSNCLFTQLICLNEHLGFKRLFFNLL